MKNSFRHRYSVTAGAAAAIAIGATLSGCSAAHAAGEPADAAPAIAVATVRVALADMPDVIEAGGVVQARTTAAITARLMAPVREVRVRPGDEVRKGQTLVVLDSADLAAAARAARSAAIASERGAQAAAAELQAAEAVLALARATYDRIAGLRLRDSATAQELDDAVANVRSAEARVTGASARAQQAASAVDSARAASDQATTTESFATIEAPFDGVITEKTIEPGNMASPGAPLLRLEDTHAFRLELRMDESRAGRIRNGDCVRVTLGEDGVPIAGTVVEVSRAVDADARAFLVKIALPGFAGLTSGQFGRASFAGSPRRAITVPPSAIVRHGQLTSVFVVEAGRARLRLVDVRESEVVAGLSESELVIVSPPAGLADGRRVRAGGR